MKDYSVLLSCGEATMAVIHDAFDKGYQQGYKYGKKIYSCDNKDMDAEYNRGLNDAWEAIKKITKIPKTKRGFVFDLSPETDLSFFSLLKMLSVQEAIAKIKEYEQQKQDTKIRVGDEVILNGNASHENEKGIILAYDGNSYPCNVLMSNGDTEWVKEDSIERKTNRHFPQIAEVLAEMRGKSE